MAPKRKRSTRTSEASEPGAIEQNGDSAKMTLRPRKVRVLSPPAHNTRSKHLSQDLDGLEEELNTTPKKRELAALRLDKPSKASNTKAVEKDEAEDVKAEEATGLTEDDHAEIEEDHAMVEAANDTAGQAQEEDSDSDAAPEAVSLSESLADARKQKAVQAKAARDQDTRAKQKRRDRDAKLKNQAEERERRRKDREEDDKKRKLLLDDVTSNAISHNGLVGDDANIAELEGQDIEEPDEFDPSTAAFLPQSILDALPTQRSPSPSSSKPQPSPSMLSKNLTLLTKHTHRGVTKLPLPQPPKDITVAPRTTVSVLQDKNKSKYLPPMVEPRGRVIKENWLLGRNTLAGLGGRHMQKGRGGRMGSSKVVRRPWGKASFA